MAYKKKGIVTYDENVKSSSRSTSTSQELNNQDNVKEASAEIQTSAKKLQPIDQEQQKKVVVEKGFSPFTDENMKREELGKRKEAIGIVQLSKGNNIKNRDYTHSPIGYQYAFFITNIHKQASQYTTRIIDTSSELYAKNIDSFKESTTTYMEYINELVFSEIRSVNTLAQKITLANIQALKTSVLNSAEITNDFSDISLNASKILMS